MSTPVLEVDRLSKRYGAQTVVDDVSIQISSGETLCLLGPSGCGKSTILRAIAGIDIPDAGSIKIDGHVVMSAADRSFVPPEKRNLGLVFQSYAIWPHMTVAQNVGYPLDVRRVPKARIAERVRDVLALVGLSGFEARSATQLSGGQQQRVALARALVYSPRLLLLDEPLSNLDARLRDELRNELRRIQRQLGLTVLYVTHDQIEALTLADRIAVMHSGRIVQLGSPAEIYDRPNNLFVHRFFGKTYTFEGTLLRSLDDCVVSLDGGVQLAVPVDDGIPDGARVKASIRAEDIRVEAESSPTSREVQRIVAVIQEIRFLGDRFECVLSVGGHDLFVECDRQTPIEQGGRIALALPSPKIKIWPCEPR